MKYILSVAAAVMIVLAVRGEARAAPPSGFASTAIVVNAQITATCQEASHVSFPNPITIDALAGSDQIFSPTVDEAVRCSNGTLFTVKVSSANGTAVGQACTSSGVSSMALRSAGTPGDTIAYTFMCAGDTDGSGHFTGSGNTTAKAFGISIKVLAGNAQAALAHADYSDTVTLTLSY
jgi:spore coat protein U-like protein